MIQNSEPNSPLTININPSLTSVHSTSAFTLTKDSPSFVLKDKATLGLIMTFQVICEGTVEVGFVFAGEDVIRTKFEAGVSVV